MKRAHVVSRQAAQQRRAGSGARGSARRASAASGCCAAQLDVAVGAEDQQRGRRAARARGTAAAAATACRAQCRSSRTSTSGCRLRGVLAGTSVTLSKRRKRACSGSSGGGAGRPGSRSRDLGDELRDVRARPAPARDSSSCGSWSWTYDADDLHPRPVGGRALALVAAAPEHLRAAQPRVRRELLGGARLADAGLADEHHQPRRGRRARPRGRPAARPAPARGRRRRRRPAGRAGSRRSPRATGAGVEARSTIAGSASRDRRGARGPLVRVLREQAQDQRLERARHLRVVPGGRDRRRVDVLGDDRDRVVAEERRAAGDHLVEHAAERVEVAARRPAARPSACSGGM